MVKSIVAFYESQEKNGHNFRFFINLRRKLSSENFCRKRHYSIVEPDAAWLVWILQAQLQDDVFRAGRLDSDEAAKHPPKTQRSQRTWSRFRSSSLAECLLCSSRAV